MAVKYDAVRAQQLVDELDALYEAKFQEEWRTAGRVAPEWYDQRISLHTWRRRRIEMQYTLHRGVLSQTVLREGDRVLDLCCGDGFYDYYFFAPVASVVDALDRDPGAIAHARTVHQDERVRYHVRDVLDGGFPSPFYDVIVLNGALDHFDESELDRLLRKTQESLANGGAVVGSTLLGAGAHWHPSHGHTFETRDGFVGWLKRYYGAVSTQVRTVAGRTDIYFRAQRSYECANGRLGDWMGH